jgi:hypothetical protein
MHAIINQDIDDKEIESESFTLRHRLGLVELVESTIALSKLEKKVVSSTG